MNKNEDKNKIYRQMLCLIILSFIIILYIPTISALEVKTQNLPSESSESKDINFDLDISDYNYASYISIETDIIKKENEPIFDFGELNEKYANIDKYKNEIILEAPKDLNNFKVKISGRTPPGIETTKTGNVEIATFTDDNLNYYKVRLLDNNKKEIGQKDSKSKIFKLIINEKIQFEKSLKNIEWEELEGAKNVARDMFDRGLVVDSKRLISTLEGIKPDDEGILPYKQMWKNILIVVIIIVAYFIGYIKGQKTEEVVNYE